jgi:YD repeat-containing protein
MKKLVLIFLVTINLGCKKESVQPSTPGKRLISLTLNNRSYITFEYQKGLLVKENSFSFCETNPSDEYAYEYTDGQLSKMKTTTRSIYSSTSALCNPALGLKGEEVYAYNGQGKIVKVTRKTDNISGITTEYTYNLRGLIAKQTIIGEQHSLVTTFEYDNKGNLVKETDDDGQIAYYVYDDKVNPYYLMNQRPAWVSAFNKSPNNVIKATGRYNFTRTFKYDSAGYPTEVSEDNGFTYKFNYTFNP